MITISMGPVFTVAGRQQLGRTLPDTNRLMKNERNLSTRTASEQREREKKKKEIQTCIRQQFTVKTF